MKYILNLLAELFQDPRPLGRQDLVRRWGFVVLIFGGLIGNVGCELSDLKLSINNGSVEIDQTPNPLSFFPIVSAPLSSQITSNTNILSGFDGSVLATVTGAGTPVILINGNEIGTSANVQAGDEISIRLLSSDTENSTRQALLLINGTVATFDVTTLEDVTAPQVISATVPINGQYKAATNLDISLSFSESVFVTGVPRIALDIGGLTWYAQYLSGSGTSVLSFRYTVVPSNNDNNGIGIGALGLNGGTIKDAADNLATLTFIAPSTNLVIVDTSPPSASQVTPPSGDHEPGKDMNFYLLFNEVVYVTGSPRIKMDFLGGAFTRYATYVAGSGTTTLHFSYTVELDVFLETNRRLDFTVPASNTFDLNGGTIQDSATNPAYHGVTVSGAPLSLCPANFVVVSAPPTYFCVAKFEMSNDLGAALSYPGAAPWVNIPRGNLPTTAGGAWKACRDLGTGYDLISNQQWQLIAYDIEREAWNWGGGVLGDPLGISRGHSDYDPADVLQTSVDTDSCSYTFQTCDLTTWSDQRRVHKLASSNVYISPEYIWDFAGNVWEWVKDNNTTNFAPDVYMSILDMSNPSGEISGYTTHARWHFGPEGDYTALSSSPYAGMGYGVLNGSDGAIIRGGSASEQEGSGIYATKLNFEPTRQEPDLGFRCVWTPP